MFPVKLLVSMFCWGESGSILGSVARIWFAHPGKGSYSSTCCCDELKSSKRKHAVVAQLVEHHLAKVDVASSSLVNRSTKAPRFASGLFRCLRKFWQVLAFGGVGWGWGRGLAIFPEVAAWVTVQSSGSLAAGKWGRKKKSSKNRTQSVQGGGGQNCSLSPLEIPAGVL